MAFLREYELRDDLLIKYFYLDEMDSLPTLVFRFDCKTRSFSVARKRFCTDLVVMDEVSRLFEFLEHPYWKSIARLVTPEHREKQPSLDLL